MPELAEVETVRNTLKKRILNKEIKDVKILYSKMIQNDLDYFKNTLINNKFIDIKRKGKWLLFELPNHYLLSHLRMEGKFFIKPSSEEYAKHEHVIINFKDGTDLRYHDTRKFGVMKIINKSDLDNTIEIQKQGIERIDDKLTKEYLLDKFKNKNIPIKTLLLDQEIISGLGNIYADEVLYASKIFPKRLGRSITLDECEMIVNTSKDIINNAIKEGGTTIRSYTSSLGVTGNYQNFLKVHKKEGAECPICKGTIKRIKVGGRSTYYCENCQK